MAEVALLDKPNTIGLPEEIISNILFHSSTPTFIQLTRTSKEFCNSAKQNRELLLHHLKQIPGPKEDIANRDRNNSALFLLLRQRATNNLYGIHFTADVTEYVSRFAKLNLGACCISGLDADYVRHALCFENSVDIRQYTANCLVKEKISQNPRTEILKTTQWNRFLSVLCKFPNEDQEDEDPSDSNDQFDNFSESESESDSETDLESKESEKGLFSPAVNALLESMIRHGRNRGTPGRKKPPPKPTTYSYRICHYDIYTLEDSSTFVIDDQPGLVPRDFIVQSNLFCAILWDKDTGNGRPTSSAKIVVYVASETQLFYAPKYDEQIIWPKRPKAVRIPSNHSDDEEEPFESPPEKIEFFRDGRRIKLYDAGGIVPYKVFASFSGDDERAYVSSNIVHYGGVESIDFYVDTPFYGMHGRYYEDSAQHDYCYQTYLCLGASKLNFGEHDGLTREANVLCILRSQTKMDPEDCDHKVNLQKMAHLSAQSSSIVARLWGWEEIHTNLTGKEAVAVSTGGTRIAIAMWDKVLIYAINPKVLCEETVVDSSDDETEKSKKKKRKSKKTWEYPATEYYHRIKDENLLDMNVAQLKPVVIDLKGAVAHRMHWSPAKGKITETTPMSVAEHVVDPPIDDYTNHSVAGSSTSSGSDTGSDTAVPETGFDLTQAEIPAEAESTCSDSVPNAELSLETTTPAAVATATVEITENSSAPETQLPPFTETNDPISQPDTISIKSDMQSSNASEFSPSTSPNLSVNDTLNSSMSTLVLSDPNATSILAPIPNSVPHTPICSQVSKASARKKEKTAEVNNENLPTHNSPKDKVSFGYTSSEHSKQKTNGISPTLSSPIINKLYPKTKQTVAEALASSNVLNVAPEATSETNSKQLPMIEVPIQDEDSEQIANESAMIISPTPADSSKEKEKIVVDLSKTTVNGAPVTHEDLPDDDLQEDEAKQEKEKEKEKEDLPKRRKRITEDELIILTDRGIQVWNLGPRAKGIRPRPRALPLEEGLAGRVPLLKQSQKGSKTPQKGDQIEAW